MNINENIVVKYAQNECAEEDIRLLNEWLSEQEENKRDLFLTAALYRTKNLKRYAAPDFLQAEKNKLLERIQQETKTVTRSLAVKKFWSYAAAAIAILVVAGVYYFNTTYSSSRILTADQGKIEHLVLPDGTQVWLNQSAGLTYPDRFKQKTRTVHLTGEAYFEVAKDAEHPFIVEMKEMKVRVLGTIFNISHSDKSNTSTVTLLEGKVQVKGNHNEGMVFLSPGQKAELNHSTRELHVKEDHQAVLDAVWHDGLIPLRQVTIAEIGKTLEKLYDVCVNIDPNIHSGTYSGVLKKQDCIATVLQSLKNSIPIEYEIKGKNVYIRGK